MRTRSLALPSLRRPLKLVALRRPAHRQSTRSPLFVRPRSLLCPLASSRRSDTESATAMSQLRLSCSSTTRTPKSPTPFDRLCWRLVWYSVLPSDAQALPLRSFSVPGPFALRLTRRRTTSRRIPRACRLWTRRPRRRTRGRQRSLQLLQCRKCRPPTPRPHRSPSRPRLLPLLLHRHLLRPLPLRRRHLLPLPLPLREACRLPVLRLPRRRRRPHRCQAVPSAVLPEAWPESSQESRAASSSTSLVDLASRLLQAVLALLLLLRLRHSFLVLPAHRLVRSSMALTTAASRWL